MSARSNPVLFATLLVGILSCSYFQLGSTEFSVAISRIPGQPAVLYSGAEVTLLCLITYNGNSSLQAAWYNGTQTLEGDDNVQLTAPYLVLGDVYVAAAHVSVLVSHTSSYRCDIISDQVSISESLQLKVTNSGTEATLDVQHPSGNVYALVPFSISCLIDVPVEVTFSFHVCWLQNGELISESDAFRSESVSLNSSAVQSDALVKEPVPGEVTYTCQVTGTVNGFTAFQVTQALPTFSVQAFPEPVVQISTTPGSGPVADSSYTLSCQATVDSALLDMIDLSWLDPAGQRVRTSSDIAVSNQVQTGGMAVLSITFTEVLPELEGTYTCFAELEITQYSTMLTSEASVFVPAPEQITSVQISPLLQTSQEWLVGSDAALVCTAEVVKASVVTFEWVDQSGTTIVSSENIKVSSTSKLSDSVFQSTLEFRGVLPSIAGFYFCTAKLSATSAIDYYLVETQSDLPPLTASVTSAQSTVRGEAQLTCTATFYQDLPLFVWTRGDGARVDGDESHVLETPVENGTHAFQVLTISPVSLLDSGEFVCTVAYQILGVVSSSQQASNFLTVEIPTPSVAVSLNFQIMDNDSLQLTCNVQLDGLQGFIPLVETSWFFDRNTSNGMEYELIPNVSSSQMSAVKVVSCGERYSSDLRLVQLVVPSDTNEVVCEASVSLPNENHVISSLGKGGISIQDVVQVEKPPSEPEVPSVRALGSSWTEVYWELLNTSSQQNYYIEYTNTLTQERQESTRVFSDLFATVSTYSAVLTDLHPATRYEYQVVAENAQGISKGILSTFTTKEAIPTGAPQDFQREATLDRNWMFTWRPPATQSQNGNITGYNFSCYPPPSARVLQDGYSIVTLTYITVDNFSQEENYTCSVAARTAQGEGPATSLQFSLSNGAAGSVAGSDNCPQDLQVYLYSLGGVTAILLVLCIILSVSFMIYYRSRTQKQKRKYTVTDVCSPPNSPQGTATRMNDYVLNPPRPITHRPSISSANANLIQDSDLSQV